MDSLFRYLVSHRSSTRNCAMALGEDFIVISPRNSTETWIEYRIEYGLATILTLDDGCWEIPCCCGLSEKNRWTPDWFPASASAMLREKNVQSISLRCWGIKRTGSSERRIHEISFAKQISSTCWTKRNMNPKCPKSIWCTVNYKMYQHFCATNLGFCEICWKFRSCSCWNGGEQFSRSPQIPS